MKKALSLLLCIVVVIAFCSCSRAGKIVANNTEVSNPASASASETQLFTDDCGRTVELPAEITKIAVSGPLTQIYLYPLAGDMFVGYSQSFSKEAEKYIPEEFLSLPELGQLYGGQGTMNLEALLVADPDVVIEIGEAKDSIKDDLDSLTAQCNIPFIHIDASVDTAADCYGKLGKLLGREEKALELSNYIERTLAEIDTIMTNVDADNARKKLVYCLGDNGLNVLAKGSYHSESMNYVSDNIAVCSEVNSKGSGNEIDMEQLMLWDPEVIIFAPDSIYDKVANDSTWANLKAVKNHSYYKTPFGPYGWLQSPPSVQRYLGMLWLTSLLYPDYCSYDFQEKVTEYYSLFYDYDLSDEEYKELTKDAF